MLAAAESPFLRCAICRSELSLRDDRLTCRGCGAAYAVRQGQPDLRPSGDTVRSLDVSLVPLQRRLHVPEPIEAGSWPPLDVPRDQRYRYGNRLSVALTTHLPPAAEGQMLLDVGCGDCVLGRYLASERGYRYFGVDVAGEDPSALADGHCLPFASDTFSAVCTFAMLEHARVPHLVASELHRVLEPGGVLLGTVAFLEPFHQASHFHHTHLGIASLLEEAGFEHILLEANREWLATDALFDMYTADRVRGAHRTSTVAKAVVRRLLAMPRGSGERLASVSAGFRFVAHKPPMAALSTSPGAARQRVD